MEKLTSLLVRATVVLSAIAGAAPAFSRTPTPNQEGKKQ